MPKGQVWKRVWILEVWSENGAGKWHFLVWNRVWISIGESGGTPSPIIPRSTLPRAQFDGANPQLVFKVDRYLGFSLDLLFPIATSLLSCLLFRRDFRQLGIPNFTQKQRQESSTRLEREWCCPEESDKEWQEGFNVTSLVLLRGHDNLQSRVLY